MAFDPTKYGARKVNTPLSTPVSQEDPAFQYSQEEKRPGKVQSIIQSLAKPFLGIAAGVRSIPQQWNATTGEELKDAQTREYDFGYFGQATPFQNPLEAAGAGLQIGSYAIPGGVGSLRSALGAGAAISGASATGASLQDGASVTDSLIAGAKAAPLGAATGGVLRGASMAVAPTVNALKSTAGFATKQITGLSPETVKIAYKSPEKLTAAQAQDLTRDAVADEVAGTLRKGLSDLRSTGQEYNAIRSLGRTVDVPPNTFDAVLEKYGLKVRPVLNKEGQIIDADILRTAESVPLGKGDVADLKDFYLQYGKETKLSTNALLNTRQGADKLANYGVGLDKTDVSNKIATDLRKAYDAIAELQVPELKALDARFAPQRKLFEKLQKDYLNSDGTLKDNAINKIANLTGAGKREVLSRLEKVSPGISEKINISRALEDVLNASGQKVGTYTRAAVLGGAGLATGNIPLAVASALVSNPQVAVKILTTFGRTNQRVGPYIQRVVSKMSTGGKLTDVERRLVYYAIGQYFAAEEEKPKQTKEEKSSTDTYLKSLGL